MTDTLTFDEAIRQAMGGLIRQGTTAREEIAKCVLEGYRVENMWGQKHNFSAMALEGFAKDLLHVLDNENAEGTSLERTERKLERMTEALLDGFMEGNSTSSISNAMDDVRREAARIFVRTIGAMTVWGRKEELND